MSSGRTFSATWVADRIAGQGGLTHAARAEWTDDFIHTDTRPRGQRHWTPHHTCLANERVLPRALMERTDRIHSRAEADETSSAFANATADTVRARHDDAACQSQPRAKPWRSSGERAGVVRPSRRPIRPCICSEGWCIRMRKQIARSE
jgi:hypothetical protein